MNVDLFDFALPPERIALRPAVPRDAARLLVLDGETTRDTLVRMTPRDVEAIMDSMLAPTAQRAAVLLGAAALVFTLWVAGVASHPRAYANLFYVLCWLAAVTYLVTTAVLAAYKNWQMRTRRLGRLSEFLLYADTWVPTRRARGAEGTGGQ